MIISIILLVITVLVSSAFIIFCYQVLYPAITKFTTEKEEINDNLISSAERNYIESEKKDYEVTDQKALVLCSCNKKFKLSPTRFNDAHTCFMVKSLHSSGTDCKYACIGLGDCVKVCAQEAISIVNNTAVISNLCCGCGNCVNICPQNIIKMVPKNTQSIVLCSNDNERELTSCSDVRKEIKVQWNAKKDFKIWAFWYKIINKLLDLTKKV